MAAVRASIARPGELGGPELDAWRAMQAALPELGNAFLAPAFARAVDRVRADVRVGVLSDGADLVGFLPFHRGPMRRGRALGTGFVDRQALVAGGPLGPLGITPPDVIRACGLDVWEFDHLVAAERWPLGAPGAHRLASPVMDLAAGFGAYLDGRRTVAGGTIASVLRKRRKLQREHGPVQVVVGADDHGALALLERWKSAQYRRTARRDRFAQPWLAALVDDLFSTDEPGCCGMLSLLLAGDRPVAGVFGLYGDGTLSSWFPAYDPAYAAYSPGMVLFLGLAEAAAGAGIDRIDLGKGDEAYKAVLADASVEVAEGTVERRSASAMALRLQRLPRRALTGLVLGHPTLRLAAHRSLERIGRMHHGG